MIPQLTSIYPKKVAARENEKRMLDAGHRLYHLHIFAQLYSLQLLIRQARELAARLVA